MGVQEPGMDRPSGGGASGRWAPLLALAAVSIALLLMRTTRRGEVETGVDRLVEDDPLASRIYLGGVRTPDAWDSDDPAEGRRYRVRIEDESRDGPAGIVRIGGVITFVDDAAPGEDVVIEVTRRSARTAAAAVVRRFESRAASPAAAERDRAPQDEEASAAGAPGGADGVVPGRVYDVRVEDADRRNPDWDGVARIDGLVVFVPHARPGDHVRIRIVQRGPRWARAERVDAGEGDIGGGEP